MLQENEISESTVTQPVDQARGETFSAHPYIFKWKVTVIEGSTIKRRLSTGSIKASRGCP